jgi:adenine phosphoribosyltransferase
VDDVISTGSTLKAVDELVRKAGGTITAVAAVALEGEPKLPDGDYELVYLAKLPILDWPEEEGRVRFWD